MFAASHGQLKLVRLLVEDGRADLNIAENVSSLLNLIAYICSLKKNSAAKKLYYWRASEASETLSGVYKFELVQYMCIYMYGGMYAIIVAHATHT